MPLSSEILRLEVSRIRERPGLSGVQAVGGQNEVARENGDAKGPTSLEEKWGALQGWKRLLKTGVRCFFQVPEGQIC